MAETGTNRPNPFPCRVIGHVIDGRLFLRIGDGPPIPAADAGRIARAILGMIADHARDR